MSGSSLDDTLARVQSASTQVLKRIDQACRKIGLRYCVYGGTAIGAIRHQGFIPWDDDVDLCMPREDYQRFLAEAPNLLGDDIVLLSHETDSNYPRSFAIVGIKGSSFVSGNASHASYPVPIGVDVFPLDRMSVDQRTFRRQRRQTWIWGRLMFLRDTPRATTGFAPPLNALAQGAFSLTHVSMRTFQVEPAVLYRRWLKAATLSNHTDSELLGDFSTQDPLRWSAREDELFPAIRMPFGDIEVNVARKYDAVLRHGYGDYMALPPEDQRVNHAAAHVDFGVWNERYKETQA